MKKNWLKSALVLSAIAVLLALSGCDTAAQVDILAVPANVQITVVNRTMTVTWNAVPNAQGYEILTTSTNCGSGNKLINTKANTATALNNSTNYLKDDGSNGAVQIKGATTIEITLMPKTMGSDEPMATAVSARVKALGGETEKDTYLDSGYSDAVTKTIPGGM